MIEEMENKIIKVVKGFGLGIILWMAIIFIMVGDNSLFYTFLGFGVIITYSILNKLWEGNQIENEKHNNKIKTNN